MQRRQMPEFTTSAAHPASPPQMSNSKEQSSFAVAAMEKHLLPGTSERHRQLTQLHLTSVGV